MKKLYFKQLLLLSCTLCLYADVISAPIISNAVAGNWSAATSWVGGVVPTAADDVTIANGTTITITANAACLSLTIGQGVSGILQYNTGATGRALTVSGDITVNNGASFRAGASGAAVNTLTLGGDFTNNGTFTCFVSTNVINITFNGTFANQTFANIGSGVVTNNTLRTLTVNNTFPGGTVTIPSGLSLASATILTLTAGTLNVGTGGTGVITLGSAAAGTFTCVRTMGSLVAATSSFGTGVTTKTYTYNGAATQTTGAELTTADTATINVLTINNALLNLTLDKNVNVNSGLTLTNGMVNTSSTTLLKLGTNVAAGILSGGTASAYINGPFARTFGVRASSATYNATTLFPVGKNGIYMPMYMAPTTTVAGVVLKTEAFDSNGGTNASASGTVSQNRWEASAIVGTGLSNLFMRQNDSLVAITNKIIKATSPAGIYSSIAPATLYATALLSSATALTATEFNNSGFFSFGDACNPLPNVSGPLNICTGAVSQFYPTAGIYVPASGTWNTSDASIAAVDAAGNVTGVNPGTATISFTISAPDGCDGLQTDRIVNIGSCGVLPGGIANNLVSWYKGDAGLSTTDWTDQTGSNNLTASGAPAVTRTLNFNPAASLNGTSDYFGNVDADGWTGSITGTSYYYVATSTAGAANSQRAAYGRGFANGATTSAHGGRYNTSIYASGTVSASPYIVSPTWAAQQTNLSRGGFNGGAAANYYVSANGSAEVTATSATPLIGGQAPFYIGRSATSGAFWLGDVAEVIAFNGKHSSADYNKIESYLALKYGISLSPAQDYTASNGTKMWTLANASTGFTSDIFGLGRDDASGLDQRVSKSTAADSVLTIATINNFTSSNQDASRSSLSNFNFETIANNNGTNSWRSAGAPAGYKIIGRRWQVQETGTIGTVYLQFDTAVAGFAIPARLVGSSPYYLLTDPDGDGNYTGGAVIPLSNASGSVWSASIDFSTGTNFTIATASPYAGVDTILCKKNTSGYTLNGIAVEPGVWTAVASNPAGAILGVTTGGTTATVDLTAAPIGIYQFIFSAGSTSDTMQLAYSDCAAPGGVSDNLSVWLKADNISGAANLNPISSWNNTRLFSIASPTGAGATRPVFRDGNSAPARNFNPSVYFGGANYLTFSNLAFDSTFNAFIVAEVDDLTSNPNPPLIMQSAGGGKMSLDIQTNFGPQANIFPYWGGGSVAGSPVNSVKTDSTNLYQFVYGGRSEVSSITQNGVFYNGITDLSINKFALVSTLGGYPGTNFGPLYLKGTIQEVIMYNSGALTPAKTQQVQSYLAIKYGITLDQSTPQHYLSSNGTVIWNASTAGTFKNNIFGIARDDSSSLNQNISRSQNVEGIVTLAAPVTVPFQYNYDFVTANQYRGTPLTNMSFETIADNGGTATWGGTIIKSLYKLLNREWKVQETGTMGNVVLQFDMANTSFTIPAVEAGTSYYLIYTDATGNYSSATVLPLYNLGSTVWATATPVDFVNGAKFTLATYAASQVVNNICPGGVGEANGMQIWLRADAGLTTSGSTVTSWNNQAQPAVIPMTSQLKTSFGTQTLSQGSYNYNPSLVLDGASLLDGSTTNTMPPGPALSFAVVNGVDINNSGLAGVFVTSGNNGNIMLNGGQYGTDANGNSYYPSEWTLTPNKPYLVGTEYTTASLLNSFVRVNGKQSAPATGTTPGFVAASGGFSIGWRSGGARFFAGKIAEVVNYTSNSQITAAQKNRIESYLALKYAITLDATGTNFGNYTLSNGNTVWDASDNPAYHRDVIALAKDATSALHQKQSHTQDDSLRLFVGNLAATNQANATAINNDLSSIIVGNDAGAPQWSPSVSKPASISERLVRTFKITNTNFSNDFSVEIKCDSIGGLYNLSNLRFLVSTTPDFSGAAIWGTPDVTFAFGSIIVKGISNAAIPANSTRFFTVGLTLVILPIDLTAFNANPVNNKWVQLDWQVASEVNNEYFTVQKSIDGKIWVDVDKVKGEGNASTSHVYHLTDHNPYKGVSYYRLYQNGSNSQQKYSPIRSVHIYNTAKIMAYPNPVSGNITLEGTATELNNIKILSVTGQDVSAQTRVISNNSVRKLIDLSGLTKGVYMIKTLTETIKIFKQ